MIRPEADHLPGDRNPEPVWLWSSAYIDRWWRSYLRRFDLEHAFRLFKPPANSTSPVRNPVFRERQGPELLATLLTRFRPLLIQLA
ncbi:hypothetical protein ACFXPN_26215 [Streptomyces griseorubiginosus]|uniref:hypothetical protein n=1 Tax=Streptomyces griseorubiginosus TaxID=67304 RepID=UPI0036D032FC